MIRESPMKALLPLLTAAMLVAPSVGAQTDRGGGEDHRVSHGRPPRFDAREMEAFLDGVLATQMKNYHIPGAAVM